MPRVETMAISPETAEYWLTRNTRNRNLRDNVVLAYARDMKNGCWDLNGESIKFSVDGELLDGQHRLQAVVVSGVTIFSLVVFDLPVTAQQTVDVGAKRQYSDQLVLAGEVNSNTLSALLRRIIFWEEGNYLFTSSRARITHAELAACLEKYGDSARYSAHVAARLKDGIGLHPSTLAFCHWLLSRIDDTAADWFFERLSDGVNLPQHHPVLVLRERIAKERASHYSLDPSYVIALVITAWNTYRDGRPLKSLKVPQGGATRENFPMPR